MPVSIGGSGFITGLDQGIAGVGIITAATFSGDLTGNVNSSGVSTVSQLNVGTGGNVITTTAGGLVGIGTTNPNYPLSVTGQIGIEDNSESDLYFDVDYGNGTTSSAAIFSYPGRFGIYQTRNGRNNNYIFYYNQDATTPSSDYLRFDVGDSEKFRVTGSGYIGIGSDNPGDKLSVYNSNIGNPTGITIRNTEASSQYSHARLRLESQNAAAYGEIWADVANAGLRLGYNSSSTVKIDSSGNIHLQNGAGIDFSATADGSGTTTSELLDDYEEGEWTPDLQFGGAKVGITYGNQWGRYIKIGRQVTLNGRIGLSSKGSSSGTARIYGLPFSTFSVTGTQMSIGSLWYSGFNLQGSIVQVVIRTDGNGTTFVEPKGLTTNNEDSIDDSDFINTTSMVLQLLISQINKYLRLNLFNSEDYPNGIIY